ncbi:MAG: hypothetical protein Q4B22_02830 [Eubacteriales bacterium]|nr:hypothetical protein [Eubacteriales bacterium]
MPKYQLADLTAAVEGAGAYTCELMKKYRIPDESKQRTSIFISVSNGMIERERKLEGGGFSEEYLEAISVYRAFCEKALLFDTVFFHASAVEKDGEAYLFSAPSGGGKSTHAELWREVFGTHVTMINDDKPLIRFLQDRVYVYGAPWDGKTHLNTNVRVPVKGICFLEKGETNRIRRIGYAEAKPLVNDQSLHAAPWELQKKNEMLLSRLINTVPVYRMQCDISHQAVMTAYEAMHREIEKIH